MVVHIHDGKGGKDRDVPLSSRLLKELRRHLLQAYPEAGRGFLPAERSRKCSPGCI